MTAKCTTLERVMRQLQIKGNASGTLKALVEDVIDSVTSEFENYMGRFIDDTVVRTEYFDVDAHNAFQSGDEDAVFYLQGYPVTSVTSVSNSDEGDYTDFVLTAGSDFIAPRGRGRLVVQSSLSTGVDALQVIYTGGMAATSKAFVDAFPDLAKAADMQCGYEYLRRKTPGASSVSNPGGTVEQVGEVDLLKAVKRKLNRHKQMGALIG